MKRFMREYASYTINEIKRDDIHNALIREIAVMRIKKLMSVYEYGYITINEFMRETSRAIDYAIETYNKC